MVATISTNSNLVEFTVWWDAAELQVKVVKLLLEVSDFTILFLHNGEVTGVLNFGWAVAVCVAFHGIEEVLLDGVLGDNDGVLKLDTNGGQGLCPLSSELELELGPDIGWATSVITEKCWVW